MTVDDQTPVRGNLGQPGPLAILKMVNGGPRSKRVGIGPYRYVWWNSMYAVMEYFNRTLAKNPDRQVSWDKWPPALGLVYLIAKIRFNRSNALTDPYDYKSNDNDPACKPPSGCPFSAIFANGKWTSDEHNGQMGSAMTRFSSNIAPRRVRPDVDKISPSAREVSKALRWRKEKANGEAVEIPALILNIAAQSWIQFQFHGFGGNTLHDPINEEPYVIPRDPSENWPNNQAIIEKTSKDPTRVAYDGRPTSINEKVHAWVQGQLYGNNEAELARLRSAGDGKLLLDPEGLLPEDPARPGVDLTGFNNNYNPYLSFLHWLFVKEHNAIVDYLRYFHPSYDEEQIFQLARKTNCAQIARIHTVEWTEDLLQHPALQLGMHADWYGLLGQRLKCYLMRLAHKYDWLNKLLKPLMNYDIFWGMPGSKWDHHDGPFQVPKHFRMVYRLHEMILDKAEVFDPDNGKLLAKINLIDFIHDKTRDHVQRFGYSKLVWSFVSKSCGALTLHNFPRSLTQFERMQDKNLIDLAELDIFREREDGTGSYNDLRRSLGEPPVTSFRELTGGNLELAREIEAVYQGDIDKVDAGIGILAEPKPQGFALGFVQFYQFVLNAPRRIKSNRFLSEGYNYDEYKEGLNWVEHGGGFKGVIRRHLPELESKLEGVKRGFAPWPDPETFPERVLSEAEFDTSEAFCADMRTLALAATAGALIVHFGHVPWVVIPAVLIPLLIVASAMAVMRTLARRYMQNCEKKCYTDKRAFMFGTLYKAEEQIWQSSIVGFCWSIAMLVLCVVAGLKALQISFWIFLLVILSGLSSVSAMKWSREFIADAVVLKVSLRNRMREGMEKAESPSELSQAEQEELDRVFYSYAPGRQYLTAYDFGRFVEVERGPLYKRMKNWKKILNDHADLIVEEDRNLVPALSKMTVSRYLQGTADIDLKRERTEDHDPSPKCW